MTRVGDVVANVLGFQAESMPAHRVVSFLVHQTTHIKPDQKKAHSQTDKHSLAMKTAVSISSFGSNSLNPSPSDYTSNQSSSFSPRPSQVIDMSVPKFPFPGVESSDPEPRPSPVRRSTSKLNLFSKLFTASRRDLKDSKKSVVRGFGKDKAAASPQSSKDSSSTTLNLSQDAAQVFGNLRLNQKGKQQRRGITRQMSEDSMIGSVLEIPSAGSSTLEEAKETTAEEAVVQPSSPPPRPKFHERVASIRAPPRPSGFHRDLSVRSVSFSAPAPPPPAPPLASSQVPPADETPRTVEISPGNFQILRGHQETLRYVRRDEVASTTCLSCSDTIYAINDAAMVVCPTCRSITPMRSEGNGLALGFTAHEWLDIQREALAMRR
eukprot:scaffold31414_cov183-Amphora_coffeaeformis.AAC.11